jgi:hypothetical protein
MAVPGNTSNYLKNTSNGTFTAAKEGGTILGNSSTGDVITKALSLADSAVEKGVPTGPANVENGLVRNIKAQGANGTFAWDGGTAAGSRFPMMGVSTSLGNYANTTIQSSSRSKSFSSNDAVMRARNQYGAKTVTALRANRFSWTGTKSYGTAGATLGSRLNWVAATTAGGNAAAAPDALNENYWDPTAGSVSANSDSAANPTRAVPGELVMMVDFVNANISTSGNFFDYKPITGM